MKKTIILTSVIAALATSCSTISNTNTANDTIVYPDSITITGVTQNPEGIEFDKNDNTFYLSSLNAGPIVKVNLDGTFKPFTSGEKYPMSTAGIQIDNERNRLLVAGFNGTELYDQDPATKGVSNLRIYNLKTGVLEKDINLSSLVPDAPAYFANDIAVDKNGNTYITDWYAGVVYKVDLKGNASIFWKNETNIPSGPNGLDFHIDGYLLISILSLGEKGLYTDYGLVKIPVKDSKLATVVSFSNKGFRGFDGMIFNDKGNVVGVTNNGTTPGGNKLIEIASKDNWETSEVINSKVISASTTVTITPNNTQFVVNQDFTNPMKENWTIEQIKF